MGRVLAIIKRYWLLIMLLLLATAWCVRPVEDIDVQWHLKIGQWMLDQGTVVTEDFYSISKWGQEWTSIPWLYQCLLAWLVGNVGWLGPTVWQWLVALLIVIQTALLIWLYRRRNTGWDWAWPALTVPAALGVLHTLQITEFRFQHRPEMTSHVMLALFVIVLTVWRMRALSLTGSNRDQPAGDGNADGNEGSPAPDNHHAKGWTRIRRLILPQGIWLLPLLQIWWANTHGVFAMGPIIIWTFIGAEWLTALWRRDVKRFMRPLTQLTGVGFAVIAACFATPYGWKTAFYPFHLLYVLTAPEYKYGISEGIPVSITGMWSAGGLNLLILAAWALALIGLSGRLLTGFRTSDGFNWRAIPDNLFRRVGLAYVLVCGGMFYISLTAIRNIPLFSLVAAPLMVNGLEYILDGLRWLVGRVHSFWSSRENNYSSEELSLNSARFIGRWETWGSRAGRLILLIGLILLYRGIVNESYYQAVHRGTTVALGQSDHSFPIAAYDFLEPLLPHMADTAMLGGTKCADMFLNRFGPHRKTYIDGRHAEVYDARFFSRYGQTLGVRGAFFQEAGKYGIGLAVFCTRDIPMGSGDLQRDIYQHPGWSLIYLDDCAVVFAANAPANAAVNQQYALPPAPAAMDEQQSLYLEWLQRSGRTDYTLLEPGNENLDHSGLARLLVGVAQLGGLFAPDGAPYAWHKSRVASLLSKLGWPAVADNIYELILAEAPMASGVTAEAIQHAVTCIEACSTQEARDFYLDRLRKRSVILAASEHDHPLADYALAYVEANTGRPDQALERLEELADEYPDRMILDLRARLTGELGDRAASPPEKERQWREAVIRWRQLLARYPEGPGTYGAYLRLGDLFQRLREPLLARANYVSALNEPDLPPAIAQRALDQVRQLETELFGGTFVPDPQQQRAVIGPFSPPPSGPVYPGAQMAGQSGGMPPVGQRPVSGTAYPSGARPENEPAEKDLYPPLKEEGNR